VADPLDGFTEDGKHAGYVRPWPRLPDNLALDREQQQLIERAIAGLPEMYRDVFVLADVEQLPNSEIGEMLGLSVPAVKSRLHRARLMMRDALSRHYEERLQ
jgi:RNA polymerase sigma-70 factor (ECF subfamily)